MKKKYTIEIKTDKQIMFDFFEKYVSGFSDLLLFFSKQERYDLDLVIKEKKRIIQEITKR